MNLSPDNRTTLETLLAGLNSGVSGSQAAPILAATLQAQAQQQQARQAQYQQMASNVANLAQSGMTQGGVSSYIDSMTQQPGIPGRFQGLLESAFPSGQQIPQGLMEPNGDIPVQGYQDQLQSPMYTQNPQASVGAYTPGGQLMSAPEQSQMAAMAQMPPPPKPTDADLMGQVRAGISQATANGKTPEEIVAGMTPAAQGIIMDNLDIFMQTNPEIVQVMVPGFAGV